MRIHRGVGIELHIAFGRRLLEYQIDIGRTMHPLEVVGTGQGRFQATQLIQHSVRLHVLVDGIQAGGRFGMPRAHFMTQAVGMGDIGSRHLSIVTLGRP
jgi:hypothetical protein